MRTYLLQDGRLIAGDGSAALPALSLTGNVWLHVTTESEPGLKSVLGDLPVHPLTIEDALNPNTRIKKERFDEYIFFVFRGFHLDQLRLHSKNFACILMGRLLITVTDDDRNTILDLIQNCVFAQTLLDRGPEYVVHRIMDVETDHTLNLIHQLEDIVDGYEEEIYRQNLDVPFTELFILKGVLQHIKRVFRAHQEIIETLLRQESFAVDSHAFFRDVNDHSIRILDGVDAIIESISNVLEAYNTLSTRNTNEIIKTLTILSAVILPISLVAGIFGMNFPELPLADLAQGFWLSLSLMGGIAGGMLLFFRLRRWI